MIDGWLLGVLLIIGAYLAYITITQPEAGFRIFSAIFMVIGKMIYFITIGIYNISLAIVNLFRGGRK